MTAPEKQSDLNCILAVLTLTFPETIVISVNDRREGSCSVGTTAPATDFFLAEGCTYHFSTFVMVQNPNEIEVEVTITYMTPAGEVPQAPFTMPANSRKTIKVNDAWNMQGDDVSTHVHGSAPIVAERAMYWYSAAGFEVCHASIGLASPHMTFYLPDGQVSDGWETWTLVMNPNPADVTIEVSYLTPAGDGNVTFTDELPANSRRSYPMAASGITGRASVMVRSLDGVRPIMCERAMYRNDRGFGTDTVGGFSD